MKNITKKSCMLFLSAFVLFPINVLSETDEQEFTDKQNENWKHFIEKGFCFECDLSGRKMHEAIRLIHEKHKDIPSIQLHDSNLADTNWETLNLKGIDINNCNLNGADFSHSVLSESRLNESDVSNANFCNADLSNGQFKNVLAKNTNFSGSNFKNTNIERTLFHNANLSNGNFENSYAKKAALVNSDCSNTNFKGVNVSQVQSFKGSNLFAANFDNTRFAGFIGAFRKWLATIQ